LYQGQATLGKIINVIMHEGRKPLGYLRNQIPTITDWTRILETNFNKELLDKIIDRLSVIGEQGKIISELFKKLDPLSAKRNMDKAQFALRPVVRNVIDIFQSELLEKHVQIDVNYDEDIKLFGWKEDISLTLANLIENSIYWLQTNEKEKLISIKYFNDEPDITVIEYQDNGPGIEKALIESEVIFEPEFSNKPGGGTGLGLAIAGEAISRNNGSLKAIYSTTGVFFKIEIKR
jgi:C4-dicarboxylate-specific signal transduction histidine kinase